MAPSFHLDGDYNSNDDPDDLKCIQLWRGYSRDHRPDLNQVVLQLMTGNVTGIPVFMAPASDNVIDKMRLILCCYPAQNKA